MKKMEIAKHTFTFITLPRNIFPKKCDEIFATTDKYSYVHEIVNICNTFFIKEKKHTFWELLGTLNKIFCNTSKTLQNPSLYKIIYFFSNIITLIFPDDILDGYIVIQYNKNISKINY